MKLFIQVCNVDDVCIEVEPHKIKEAEHRSLYSGEKDGYTVSIAVTESQSNPALSGEDVDYSTFSPFFAIAFSSVVFFYYSGRMVGVVLELIKREA